MAPQSQRWRRSDGMSLVEATIILMVLMLLTGTVAPSLFDYVNDARMVKVKEDCEAIGTAIVRLVRDVGPCLQNGRGGGCTVQNRADVLWSDGPILTTGGAFTTNATQWAPPVGGTTADGSYNWFNDPGAAPANHGGPLVGQLVTNWSTGSPALAGTKLYSDIAESPGAWSWTAPVFGLGWRGAYLPSPIGPDPWGLPYFVNSVFLAIAHDAPFGSGGVQNFVGTRNGGWPYDVFVISAGPNQLFETPFAPGALPVGSPRGGDDFIYVIQGSTR